MKIWERAVVYLGVAVALICTGIAIHAYADGDAGAPYFEITEGAFSGQPRQEYRYLNGEFIEMGEPDGPLQPYDEVLVPRGSGFIESEDGYRIWIQPQPPEGQGGSVAD